MSLHTAAALIRSYDPALAAAFLAKPFHRHMLVSAFHRSLSRINPALADEIAVACRSAIDADKTARAA
jgi:hypothetical protein